MNWIRAFLCAALPLSAPAFGGEPEILTLDQALSRARERAPAIVSARARVDEARARLEGATSVLREGPVIEALAGPRSSSLGDSTDLDLSVSQSFEMGGRRGARTDGAEAALAWTVAAGEDAARRLLADVAVAFQRALCAAQRVDWARTAENTSEEVLAVAQRLLDAGEVPFLDVGLAKVALANARARALLADADREAALGDLKKLLGMDVRSPLGVRGDLSQHRDFDLADLLSRVSERPDLRALDASIREAEAEDRLSRGLNRPDLGLGIRYEREEAADIWLGGIRVMLPAFARNRALRAEAQVRVRRLVVEREALRRAAEVEVAAAYESWRRRVAVVEELEKGALPVLEETEGLLRRSYEAGEIGLLGLLAGQKVNRETRWEYLDHLLDAAVAGVALEAAAGVL